MGVTQRYEQLNTDKLPRKYVIDEIKSCLTRNTYVSSEAAHYFYESLILLDCFSYNSKVPSCDRKQIKWNQKQLHKIYRSQYSPNNYQYQLDLVEAETYRAVGDKLNAIEHYELAISYASEYGFDEDKAIANQLAAGFYFEWGKDNLAALHLKEAYDCYRSLGLLDKAALLLPLLPNDFTEASNSESNNAIHTDFYPTIPGEKKQAKINKHFQRVLDFSSIGIWKLDHAENKLTWDQGMFQIYGVDPNDFRGTDQDWSDRLHPDDRDRAMDCKLGQARESEFRIVRPDGEVRYIFCRLYVEVDENDRLLFTFGLNQDITDFRKMETTLKDTQSRLQTTVQDFPGFTFRSQLSADSIESIAIDISSNCEDVLDVSAESIVSGQHKIIDFIHPEDQDRVALWWHRKQKDFVSTTNEFRIVTLSGVEKWLRVSSHPVKCTNDGSSIWDSSIYDITSQKTAERALAESEKKYRALVEDTVDTIWTTDTESNITYLSPRFKSLSGFDPQDWIGKSAFELCHPDDRKSLTQFLQRIGEDREALEHEYRHLRHDGSCVWVMICAITIYDDADRVIGKQGIIRDISDRKEVEIALNDSQTRFHRMNENVPGMIYRYVRRADKSHYIDYVNSNCRDLYDVSPEDALDNADLLLMRIHPEDIERITAAVDVSAENLTPLKEEFRVILPTRGVLWRQVIAQPARNEKGDTIWDGVTLDVTNRKLAESKLKSANKQLAEATRMKDEFLANMSHELRTPLSAILGMNEGISRGLFGPVTDDQVDGFKVIQESGAHLLELINEVLDLAKIESGSMQLDLVGININRLCNSSFQFVTLDAQQKNIKLVLNVPINLPDLQADEKRLRQILVNLLSNAIKFTNDNGKVTLAVERINHAKSHSEELIRFSVTDTGIGIESCKLNSLFEPFVQIETALNRDHGGTGLGLSLVRQFSKLLGGSVGATSDVGVGSCFFVDLPFRQELLPAKSDVKELSSIGKISRGQPTPSILKQAHDESSSALILLVEDNEAIAKSTMRHLNYLGFRVHRVSDGEAAIEAAYAYTPDIILMDIQMPTVDGFEVIRRLRTDPLFKTTPIIAITGLAMQGDGNRCIEAGADHYLSKPYRMQELVDLVEQHLHHEVV